MRINFGGGRGHFVGMVVRYHGPPPKIGNIPAPELPDKFTVTHASA